MTCRIVLVLSLGLSGCDFKKGFRKSTSMDTIPDRGRDSFQLVWWITPPLFHLTGFFENFWHPRTKVAVIGKSDRPAPWGWRVFCLGLRGLPPHLYIYIFWLGLRSPGVFINFKSWFAAHADVNLNNLDNHFVIQFGWIMLEEVIQLFIRNWIQYYILHH